MVGPLLTFAFLLLPPMIAFRLSTRFHAVPVIGGLVGAFIAFFGFLLSYSLDWPTSATDAVLGCAMLGAVTSVQWVLRLNRASA